MTARRIATLDGIRGLAILLVLAGHIATYDGRSDALRLVAAHARAACCLCGANPSLVGLDEQRYLATHACGGDAA